MTGFLDPDWPTDEDRYEVELKKRGWLDEYEAETAIAMNYGEGFHDGEETMLAKAYDALAMSGLALADYMAIIRIINRGLGR